MMCSPLLACRLDCRCTYYMPFQVTFWCYSSTETAQLWWFLHFGVTVQQKQLSCSQGTQCDWLFSYFTVKSNFLSSNHWCQEEPSVSNVHTTGRYNKRNSCGSKLQYTWHIKNVVKQLEFMSFNSCHLKRQFKRACLYSSHCLGFFAFNAE